MNYPPKIPTAQPGAGSQPCPPQKAGQARLSILATHCSRRSGQFGPWDETQDGLAIAPATGVRGRSTSGHLWHTFGTRRNETEDIPLGSADPCPSPTWHVDRSVDAVMHITGVRQHDLVSYLDQVTGLETMVGSSGRRVGIGR
jgi:hypothetical protein